MNDDKTIVIAAQIPREVFDKLNALAKAQDRTRSYLIRRIVTEALFQDSQLQPAQCGGDTARACDRS